VTATAGATAPSAPRPSVWASLGGYLGRIEAAIPAVFLVAMAALPIAEMGARLLFDRGVPGQGPLVQHLTLWVGFLGAALAARQGRLLALASDGWFPEGRWRLVARTVAAAVGAAVSALLARASFDMAWIERESATEVALGLPVWVAQLVLPISFGLIALRLAWRAGLGDLPEDAEVARRRAGEVEDRRLVPRLIAAAALGVGVWLGHAPALLEGKPALPWVLVVLLATALGAPLFVLLGGLAVFLFLANGVPTAAVPVETYRLAVSPTLAAIPLFTLAGFLLAEGQASTRLLRLFRALVGWIPGGTAVVCALLCAFFTAFTGGSGVTILALGALLYQALRADGYREDFALGLLTSAGSLGLLFAPSLPLILFGIVGKVPIEQLFLAGILPGFLLVGTTAAFGIREGLRTHARRSPFVGREAVAALWGAKWELAIPALVLGVLLGGFATVVEAAAITVLYVLLAQTLVHRDLPWRQVPRVVVQCVVVVGGVLVILGVAMGFSSYLVDDQVPARLLEWARTAIGSPAMFLLALNLFLLVVGCLMDVFSAIVVVVPLIVPLGLAFGIDPVHLGIIFVANLELGYLTPPVGMNLFLASYRFGKPMLTVARATMPWLLLRAIAVLLITYLPLLSTWLPSRFGE
jgi:C4-dicarboxylate transporter DctM subunit